MSVEQMRAELAKVYGERWTKSKNDSQVMAIYTRLLNKKAL